MTDQPLPSKAKSPVFQSLQAGRGIAALAVVLFHCEVLLSQQKYWAAQNHYFRFGASGVDFFFVLSGIVILHAHLLDLNQPKRFFGYIKKRCKRIYPIYWIILIGLLPLYFVSASFGKGFETQPKSIVDAFLLLPIFRPETIIPVAWTLEHEIMFYLVFGTLLLSKRWGRVVLGVWLLASIFSFAIPPGHPLLAVYLSPLHLLFGIGMLARFLWQRVDWKGGLFVLAGAAGLVACATVDDILKPLSALLPLAYGFCAFLVCFGCMLIEKVRPIRIPRALLILGNASYSLYLVHFAVLSAVSKVVYRGWLWHRTSLVVPFLILFAISVAAGLIVHFCVEVPLLRWMTPRRKALRHSASTLDDATSVA